MIKYGSGDNVFHGRFQHILVNITKDEEKHNAKVQRRIIQLNDYFGSQGSDIASSDHSIDPQPWLKKAEGSLQLGGPD